MAKKSFLNRLFGSDSDESAKNGQVQKAKKPAETEQSKKPQNTETPPEPPKPEVPKLEVPADHSLHQLCGKWAEQTKRMPVLDIYMKVPPESEYILSESDAKKELLRLMVVVTATANKRVAKLKPKKEDEPVPDLDAQVVVFMTSDRLSAWLFVYPPVGLGGELSREMIVKALAENKISFGINKNMINSLPENPERYFNLFMIAEGKKTIHGQDGRIIDFFPRVVQHQAEVDESGRVDYTSLNFVQNVKIGDAICQVVPPVPGVHGRTVTDQELTAREGRVATPPSGRNTMLSEDGEMVVATKAGHVEFNGVSFQVNPVLEIEGNVDYSTGNINFLGDVHVHGDVCAGFSLRATGNITVDGVVESSMVESGCDLIVVKGVQGNGQAVIRAHRSIFAKYLENCSAYVREDLQADCILNCDVYSDGVVEVRSGRGIIIGGSIRAAKEVNANIVGSKSECITDVTLGGLPFEEFEYERLFEDLGLQIEELEKLEQMPESPAKANNLTKARMRAVATKKKLEQFASDIENLKGNIREQPGTRLRCNVAYPGTNITIGRASMRIEKEVKLCDAVLEEGEVRLK